jgi:hypothetical protein
MNSKEDLVRMREHVEKAINLSVVIILQQRFVQMIFAIFSIFYNNISSKRDK